MNEKTTITITEINDVDLHSEELKNQVLELARRYLGHARRRFGMKELHKMEFKTVIEHLNDIVDVIKPFAQLKETDILSDSDLVVQIKANYYRKALGGRQDCEMFIKEGADNNTPQCLVNLIILEACANFVLANVFKVKWDTISKMYFGSKIEYIRLRYHLLSRFMATIPCN